MALIRWNPGNEIFNLHSELDRVFNDMAQGLMPAMNGGGNGTGGAFLPLDIRRTDDALEITASVPGFRPDDVAITVDNGVLTIEARREDETEEKDKAYIRRERYSGRLFRQVVLGDGINGEDARASFSDGELSIRVPLVARAEPKRIPVATTTSGESSRAVGAGKDAAAGAGKDKQ